MHINLICIINIDLDSCCTVEPRFNDLRFNDIPGITISIRFPGKSYIYTVVKCMGQNPSLTIFGLTKFLV